MQENDEKGTTIVFYEPDIPFVFQFPDLRNVRMNRSSRT